jgi:hypothetical protein
MMQRYYPRDDISKALALIPGWLRWAEQQDVAGAYIALWMTFNAIYVAEYRKPYAAFKEKDGEKEFANRYEYGFQMVKVKNVSERDMIQDALKNLPDGFKRKLIALPSPRSDATCLGFFANRKPLWQGESIEQDVLGQKVRGVINVRETISKDYPRWVPVDGILLNSFLAQHKAGVIAEIPHRLIEQIGDILYTVRNNLFHGCKGPEDSNDNEVLCHALEMLRSIVMFYLDKSRQPANTEAI